MNIRQIEYFLAVANHLHFRKAAEALGLTQPALTARIRDLEQELGVQLLKRNRQVTALTYAGNIFRKDVSDMLIAAEQATERVRRTMMGALSFLRIGFISTASTSYFLPQIIKEFRLTYPNIELTLQNFSVVSQVEMIENGSLDIAFLRMPISVSSQVEVIPVYKEPHVLLFPANSPFAKQKVIHPKDLQQTPFVMHARESAPGYHDMIMRSLNNNGVNPMIAQEVGEMYTMVSLVSAGIGAAVAPISTLNYRMPGIFSYKAGWLPASEVAMAFRTDNVDPATRLFIDHARRSRPGSSNLSPDKGA